MVLALQGGMAVGKTTAARYVAAHDPAVAVFFEDNSPALSTLQGRGLDKHRFADYCEIQRAFIQQEIDRYDRAAACSCALIDLGPQEIEFYTLFYPASIGKDWPVRQALAAELAALRRCRIDRTLFLQASVSVLQQRKEGDTTRDRGLFLTTPYNTCCLPRSVGLQRNPAWIFCQPTILRKPKLLPQC